MTEEPEEGAGASAAPKKKSGMKQMIIIVGLVAVLGGGGFFGYTKFFGKHEAGKEGKEGKEGKDDKKPKEQVLIPVESIIVNLTDKNRFIKLSLQLEVSDKKHEELLKEKMPLLKDAIIMLLTSKSFEAISGPDGKMMLKDEILARLNQALGKEIIGNIYFTELMVQ
ncbi:MAG: flagellar basal body-associated FliL family protein [Candidatus Magnetominusculus sp. LBB02]|nr:flagellar basal body-associated FliL family protein [Candidatus Magnetominusculus sp. LBB02]